MAIEKQGTLAAATVISGGQGKIIIGAASAEEGGVVIDAGTIAGHISGGGTILDNAFAASNNAQEQIEFINEALKADDAVTAAPTSVFLNDEKSVTPAAGTISVITGGHGFAIVSKEDEDSVKVKLNDLSFPFAIEEGVTLKVEKGAFASYATITTTTTSTERPTVPVTLFPGDTRTGDAEGTDELLAGKGTAEFAGTSRVRLNNLNNAYPFTVQAGEVISSNNASIMFVSSTGVANS